MWFNIFQENKLTNPCCSVFVFHSLNSCHKKSFNFSHVAKFQFFAKCCQILIFLPNVAKFFGNESKKERTFHVFLKMLITFCEDVQIWTLCLCLLIKNECSKGSTEREKERERERERECVCV